MILFSPKRNHNKANKKDVLVTKKEMVLITGANGLLGANVVALLSKSKEFVPRAMVRSNANLLSLEGVNCELFEGDITNPEDVNMALEGCSYIIHCAARTSQYPSSFEHYREVNINSTRLLLEAGRLNGVKRMVFVSSTNCFTNGSLQEPGTEEGGFMPWLKASGYAFSKFLAQQEVLIYGERYHFPVIVVAPGFLVGARDAKPSSGKMILYILKNRIVFCPPGGKSFVDAEIAAQAAVNALCKGKTGHKYLLAGENMTLYEFFKLVSRLSGKRRLVIPLPMIFFKSIAIAFELLEKFTGIPFPLNTTQQKLLCLDNYFSNYMAKKELDMKSTKVDIAIKKSMDWFKRYGYIN